MLPRKVSLMIKMFTLPYMLTTGLFGMVRGKIAWLFKPPTLLQRAICLIICILTKCSLQIACAQDFASPLDIPILLSSNFGELRMDQFHFGIDIKTGGVSGLNVYAIDSGYVARIKVEPGGYGRALYISHPNG